MGTKDIFISYKSEEFDEALWVKNQLESQGISCWMAPMSITGGASYATEIPAAIKNCKVFVLILSKRVQNSKWVPRELDQAINADKLIMPFMIENCTLKNDFQFYLSNVQRYYAYIDHDKSFKKMVTDIKKHLGIEDTPDRQMPEEKSDESIEDASEKKEPKPEPEVKTKPKKIKAKRTYDKKKNKKKFVIGGIAATLVLILTVCFTFLCKNQKIVFCGEKFQKSAYTVEITDRNITQDDIKELGKFEHLGVLSFANCTFEFEDLGALSQADLSSLTFSSCHLTDAQLSSMDFEHFNRLTTLNLDGNDNLTDFSVIAPLADTLEILNINNIHISDFGWLQPFQKLTEIYIDNTGITNLDPITNMAYLKVLHASNNNLESLQGLENATVLETIYLDNNSLSDVSILANSYETLKTVSLNNNSVIDLYSLSACTQIRYFSANKNDIYSMRGASDWNELYYLSLADNDVMTIDYFPKSSKLTYADLSGNNLSSFSGDSLTFADYTKLNLSNNVIWNISLPKTCNYSVLALHGNPIDDISFFSDIEATTMSLNYFEDIDLDLLSKKTFVNAFIAECPTNRKVKVEKALYGVQIGTKEQADEIINKEMHE